MNALGLGFMRHSKIDNCDGGARLSLSYCSFPCHSFFNLVVVHELLCYSHCAATFQLFFQVQIECVSAREEQFIQSA